MAITLLIPKKSQEIKYVFVEVQNPTIAFLSGGLVQRRLREKSVGAIRGPIEQRETYIVRAKAMSWQAD